MLILKSSAFANFLFLLCISGQAQIVNSHDVLVEKEVATMIFSPRISIQDLPKGYYTKMLSTKIDEFEERMKSNAQKYQQMEKEMKKPQYSDPMYFGHKRRPKKRVLKKRRLCSECGIVH